MNLDQAKLRELLRQQPALLTVLATGTPAEWLGTLHGRTASELGDAVAALGAAAVDAPTLRRETELVVKVPFFHHGDLSVEGNLTVLAPLFITGNLAVSGVMRDCAPDSSVAIGGNLVVGSLDTDGEFTCGNIDARDVVCGAYNDHTIDCGRIRARVVIADEHDMQHAGVEAELDYSDLSEYQQGRTPDVQAALKRVFVDDVFYDAEGELPGRLNREELFRRLLARAAVFRT